MCISYFRGSQSSSGPASAGPHPPTGSAPFGMPANRGSAASLTEELRKTLESSYLDGGFPNGPPGSAGGQRKASSREKVGAGCKDCIFEDYIENIKNAIKKIRSSLSQ